jgi:hypothetical protein
MRLLDPKAFKGTTRVRMLANCVAGQRPRLVGDELELPALEAAELIHAGHAEKVIEGPRLVANL